MAVNVLIVDDSIFIRQMLSKIIAEDSRFNLIGTASNGRDALYKIRDLKPDVITLDVEMPIMDGLETLMTLMVENPTPVIMLSSLTTEGAKTTLKALELGAIDFIAKPHGLMGRDIDLIAEELKEKLLIAAGSAPQKLKIRKLRGAMISPKTESNSQVKVVIIGTSTGGPSALNETIRSLPSHLRVPVIVAQHMPVGFTKLLAERLNNTSELTVKEVENNEILQPGKVYIIPAGKQINFKRMGQEITLSLTNQDTVVTPFKPSVDVTLLEALKVFNQHLLAVILTGMGNDGLRGVRALKSVGGKVIAEAKETCVVYGMPRAIVEENLADEVLPIDEISQGILRSL